MSSLSALKLIIAFSFLASTVVLFQNCEGLSNEEILSGQGALPDPGNPPPQDRGDQPDPDPFVCPPAPNNVVIMSDWQAIEGTTGTWRYTLRDEIKSFAFNSTNGSVTAGRLETTQTSSNKRVRSTWVSKCPGGPPLPQSIFNSNPCLSTRYEVTSIRWSDSGAEFTCQLQPDSIYYLNIRSAESWDAASGNCNANNCGFWGVKTVQ